MKICFLDSISAASLDPSGASAGGDASPNPPAAGINIFFVFSLTISPAAINFKRATRLALPGIKYPQHAYSAVKLSGQHTIGPRTTMRSETHSPCCRNHFAQILYRPYFHKPLLPLAYMLIGRDRFRGQPDMQLKTIRVRTYFGVLLGLWTFSVTGLFVNDALHIRQSAKDLAVGTAQAYLNKDQAIRLWASCRGGVYVPVSDQTQPNPYLSHVIDRGISTPSGTRLTLINPAYMIRQVMEHYAGLYDVRWRITSLRHFRVETAPGEWESRMFLLSRAAARKRWSSPRTAENPG